MGKRELLIITAFVVVGVVAYQLGAAPAEGRRRFSLATLMDHFRRRRPDARQRDRSRPTVPSRCAARDRSANFERAPVYGARRGTR